MLKLKNIVKDYQAGENVVHALKDISINFRKSEFVSILGQSGCGKTTMLNIIGGLDRYTSGDLVINGTSTTQFKDRDWDTYRNQSVGFVFQSYNLISHLSVLGNVELALTLSGVTKKERKERAIAALEEVGLKDQVFKKPNQLSGGQMQRVAIARALINNPEIILADEPTGALDTETSVQVMEILKKIAKKRLIIMVTHNPEIAETYSTRIINMRDGEVLKDSNPFTEKDFDKMIAKEKAKIEAEEQKLVSENNGKKVKSGKGKKSSMSYSTALGLSGKNLLSKKAKTFMTAFAGSIGIIGIALVLAISNGFSGYITQMQTDILGGYPIEITTTAIDLDGIMTMPTVDPLEPNDFNDDSFVTVKPKDANAGTGMMGMPSTKFNYLSQDFIDYMNTFKTEENEQYYNEFSFSYESNLNVFNSYDGGAVAKVSGNFYEGLTNQEYVNNQYDVLAGTYPKNANEVALVIPNNNYIDEDVLKSLGISYTLNADSATTIDFNTILNNSNYKVVLNDQYYTKVGSSYVAPNLTLDPTVYETLYTNTENIDLTVTAVLRVKEQANISLFDAGIMYLPSLTEQVRTIEKTSGIVTDQLSSTTTAFVPYVKIEYSEGNPVPTITTLTTIADVKVELNKSYNTELTDEQVVQYLLQGVSGSSIPASLQIYPVDFGGKEQVLAHLDGWNKSELGKNNPIYFTDFTGMFTNSMTMMVDIISYVLIAFASVSLFVSSIMIGVLTYASVIERTKEIGVLRSIGARKKDVSRVFNSETFIIGVSAGTLGILVTYLLCPIINAIIIAVAGGAFTSNIAILNPLQALGLIIISAGLTLIAGLIPSRIAANKDPVKALRSE